MIKEKIDIKKYEGMITGPFITYNWRVLGPTSFVCGGCVGEVSHLHKKIVLVAEKLASDCTATLALPQCPINYC
jgi:hypothetical protein